MKLSAVFLLAGAMFSVAAVKTTTVEPAWAFLFVLAAGLVIMGTIFTEE